MKKPFHSISSVKLQKHTTLNPILCNVTRWSFRFQMLKRYEEFRDFLFELHVPGLDELLQTAKEDNCVDNLIRQFEDLDSMTKALQKEQGTIETVCSLFEGVIENFPETLDRLRANADIFENEAFETAWCKI